MDKNTVKEQILAIRDSGVTNMFDIARVVWRRKTEGFGSWSDTLSSAKRNIGTSY